MIIRYLDPWGYTLNGLMHEDPDTGNPESGVASRFGASGPQKAPMS